VEGTFLFFFLTLRQDSLLLLKHNGTSAVMNFADNHGISYSKFSPARALVVDYSVSLDGLVYLLLSFVGLLAFLGFLLSR
jgi:hypothetical protein